MAIKTINIHECDRCGYQTENPDEWVDGESGNLHISYSGSLGSMSYNGDCGGVNIGEKKWICLKCTKEFIEFMAGENNER